jgi:hypothetical protein
MSAKERKIDNTCCVRLFSAEKVLTAGGTWYKPTAHSRRREPSSELRFTHGGSISSSMAIAGLRFGRRWKRRKGTAEILSVRDQGALLYLQAW